MWDAVLAQAPTSIVEPTTGRRPQPCVGVHLLAPEDAYVYNTIISKCNTDDELRDLVRRAADGHGVSARSMHMFVVKYAPAIDMHIFISNGHVSQLPPPDGSNDTRVVHVHASYANKMALFGKTLFDAFGRGRMVMHEFADGSVLNMSLCRINFFMWAQEIKLADVMHLFAVDFKRFQDTGVSMLVPRPFSYRGVSINVTVPSIALLDMRSDEIAAAAADTCNEKIVSMFGAQHRAGPAAGSDAVDDLIDLLTDVHDDAVLIADVAPIDSQGALEDVQLQMIIYAERVREIANIRAI